MAEKPWQEAFVADAVVGICELAQILAAAPEMEGVVCGDDIVFDRVPVPERYDTLPPRKEPLHVVVVADTPVDDAVNG